MGRASPIVLAVQKARQRSGGQNAIGIDEHRRRTLYVAMTRAKDNLHLIVPQRFFTHGQSAQGDRHVYASRTRFIPNELLGFSIGQPGQRSRRDSPLHGQRARACASTWARICVACDRPGSLRPPAPQLRFFGSQIAPIPGRGFEVHRWNLAAEPARHSEFVAEELRRARCHLPRRENG